MGGMNTRSDRTNAAYAHGEAPALDLAAIERRIADCASYNFGMRDADQLAHVDAPALLAELRAAQQFEHSEHQAAKYYKRMQVAELRAQEAERHNVRLLDEAVKREGRVLSVEAVIAQIDELVTSHYLDTSVGRAVYEITGTHYKRTTQEES